MSRDPATLDADRNLFDWAAVDLRRWMKLKNASHEHVARIIGRDRSLVSKILTGESPMQREAAEDIDAAWDTGGLFERIVRLAKGRHNPEWGVEREAAEGTSTMTRVWAPLWIPVLAQTEEYAFHALTECGRTDVQPAVAARLARQERVLARQPQPFVWLLIDQDALEHRVGPTAVHAAQLSHLLEIGERQCWTVRVVSRDAGGHVGRDGAFCLYRTSGDLVAYVETLGPGRLILDASEADWYDIWFTRISDVALNKQDSRTLIESILEGIS